MTTFRGFYQLSPWNYNYHGVDRNCKDFHPGYGVLWMPGSSLCTSHRAFELRLGAEHHL